MAGPRGAKEQPVSASRTAGRHCTVGGLFAIAWGSYTVASAAEPNHTGDPPGSLPSPVASLHYVRHSDCPRRHALVDAVAARLGNDPFVPDKKWNVRVRILQTTEGYQARIVLRRASEVVGQRVLRAGPGECADLVSSVAVTLSVLLAPKRLLDLEKRFAPPRLPRRTARARAATAGEREPFREIADKTTSTRKGYAMGPSSRWGCARCSRCCTEIHRWRHRFIWCARRRVVSRRRRASRFTAHGALRGWAGRAGRLDCGRPGALSPFWCWRGVRPLDGRAGPRTESRGCTGRA